MSRSGGNGSASLSVEAVWEAGALLGEAPVWLPDEGLLYWVDIDGKTIFCYDPETDEKQAHDIGQEVGCILPREKGGFVAGLERGIGLVGANFDDVEIVASPEGETHATRFNDGKCDRRGRFWLASTDRDETRPLGALYCVDGRQSVSKVLDGITVGNGMGWSPDDRTMYFTDTGVSTIYAFDYDIDTGGICNQRVFATVDEADGLPDGLTVDAEGCVWSAHWGGSRITRYTPDGAIDRVIRMPVPYVTSLAFGGSGLDQLFITTARLGMSDDQLRIAPLSGSLFVTVPGVVGLPERRANA